MKDNKISNEENLLVALCEYAENGEVNLYRFMTDHPMDGFLFNAYFKALTDKGYIVLTSKDYATVTPSGFKHASSLHVIPNRSVKFLKEALIGIFVAVIAGFILWKLGWN